MREEMATLRESIDDLDILCDDAERKATTQDQTLTLQRVHIAELAVALRDVVKQRNGLRAARRRSHDFARCVHCDVTMLVADARRHWQTCPKHPAKAYHDSLRHLHEVIRDSTVASFEAWLAWDRTPWGQRCYGAQRIEGAFRQASRVLHNRTEVAE